MTKVENKANAILDREIGRRTSTSMFGSDGRFLIENAGQINGQVALGEYLNLAAIPWAPEPYGAEHCQWLARLVEYMAQLPGQFGGVVGGPLDSSDQKILHAAAMLYAVGRGDPRQWNGQGGLANYQPAGEPGYAARSAAFADKFLREGSGAGTFWEKSTIREAVCGVIFRHTDEREIKEDKRLQVFADALRLELCRIQPNTAEGMALLRREWKPELFHMGWSRDKANARQWMITRGWK